MDFSSFRSTKRCIFGNILQDFGGSFQSWSPPYLRAGPLPKITCPGPVDVQWTGLTGFPKILRLDLKTEFADFGNGFRGLLGKILRILL